MPESAGITPDVAVEVSPDAGWTVGGSGRMDYATVLCASSIDV